MSSSGRAAQKQTMHELKLRRLLEFNHRLREELSRPRMMVSVATSNLIAHCQNTKDPLIPSLWGPLAKGEDPYAPVEQGGCCSRFPRLSQNLTFFFALVRWLSLDLLAFDSHVSLLGQDKQRRVRSGYHPLGSLIGLGQDHSVTVIL